MSRPPAPNRREDGYVLLEDGTRFDGDWCGAERPATGEVVFTTGMSGYQESMTDPSFAGQLITFTYPHIGNYGVSAGAMESERVWARAAIMREACNREDAPAAERGWLDWLTDCGVSAISGIDTRALVRHIRDAGAMRGGVFPASVGAGEARELVEAEPPMAGQDLACVVTPKEVTHHGQSGSGPRIAVIDTGIKSSMVRELSERGARVSLYPCASSAGELLAEDPDAIFLANGPGDPAALGYVVQTVRELVGRSPYGVSVLVTSCSAARSAWRPSSCPSATTEPTTPSATCRPDAWRSPPRTMVSPRSALAERARSSATSRCAGRRTSVPPRSRT